MPTFRTRSRGPFGISSRSGRIRGNQPAPVVPARRGALSGIEAQGRPPDSDDLEIYAYRLLQGAEAPDILYWLDRKILHFLVDEFQDTSDIQWAILDKLTEEIFRGPGSGQAHAPNPFRGG